MIQADYNIPIFNFDLKLVQIEEKDTLRDIDELLDKIGLVGEERHFINPSLVDGGHTMTNENKRIIVVVFHRFINESAKIETYGHEKRHVVDRICMSLDIQDLETASYLSGYLEKIFYLQFDRLLNDTNEAKKIKSVDI